MAEIRVWAPNAHLVELESKGRLATMKADSDGWFILDEDSIAHGDDYSFRVDGKGPFPDPRSPWQPYGVHGSSRWVDHAGFAWSDKNWQQPPLGSALIYELHVGTFTQEGTFDAMIERLDYLADLGVTHVELMPVAEFSGNRGWGYDGVDLYAPHHAYGGPEGLKRLVDGCHRKGLAVLLDVVYNHLGPAGNYLGHFGPYFTRRYVTPWGDAVNLDGPGSDEVRRFFVDNALMWLRDYHIDGLRIDAVHAIVDMSAIHFLEELSSEVDNLEAELGRHLVLIAESDLNDPRVVRCPEVGGYGIDAQWNEDFHHALHAVLTGEQGGYYQDFGRLSDLAKVLMHGLVYDGCYSVYRSRRHGRPASGLSGHSFVGCLQNHDQVGNRAMGERTSHLLTPGQLKIGAALVLTAPFIPMLFQGEEWGASSPFLYFTDHQDPELARAVRRGRQEEFAAFGWDPDRIPDPQTEESFLRSRLDWEESLKSPHREILQWYRRLIDLRRSLPVLSDARMEQICVHVNEEARWLTMSRGSVLVACNLADARQRIPCSALEGKHVSVCSEQGAVIMDNEIVLPGNAV
ncbi:MAG TPA: malto-oligosyltrehalose trehalohydrolase, partial [Deltaproteobacteria bacterium]|nr:malto-oligosyltrehalose trehalohydrolase [Deltaproteobacteria bacterium]